MRWKRARRKQCNSLRRSESGTKITRHNKLRLCSVSHMTSPSDSLPDDIVALRAFANAAVAERDAADAAAAAVRAEKVVIVAERDRLIEQNDRFRHLLRQLQRMQFGRKSERLDSDQFQLALEDIEQAIARLALKTKTVPENGSSRRCSLTSAVKPSIPLRKSTGLVATRTRTGLPGTIIASAAAPSAAP